MEVLKEPILLQDMQEAGDQEQLKAEELGMIVEVLEATKILSNLPGMRN